MIEFIKTNIGWIKDLGTLFLAVTATVISILTYRRARATILQPIRNEVIKKQSEILSALLSFIREHENNINFGLDYSNIARINALLTIIECGYKFKDQENIEKEIGEHIACWVIKPKTDQLEDFEIIGPIASKKTARPENSGKEKYELAKQGKASITKISITKKHNDFYRELEYASENAFLPLSIQNELKKLIIEININRTDRMIETLEEFINAYAKVTNDGNYQNINPSGVYNQFNRKAINHNIQFSKLKKSIREYLKIDDNW